MEQESVSEEIFSDGRYHLVETVRNFARPSYPHEELVMFLIVVACPFTWIIKTFSLYRAEVLMIR